MTNQPATALYTSADVQRICDVSNRNLQWWDEQNIVAPRIVDHKRLYTEEELEQVRRIKQLRQAGASLRECRKCLKLTYQSVLRVTRPTVVAGILIVPR